MHAMTLTLLTCPTRQRPTITATPSALTGCASNSFSLGAESKTGKSPDHASHMIPSNVDSCLCPAAHPRLLGFSPPSGSKRVRRGQCALGAPDAFGCAGSSAHEVSPTSSVRVCAGDMGCLAIGMSAQSFASRRGRSLYTTPRPNTADLCLTTRRSVRTSPVRGSERPQRAIGLVWLLEAISPSPAPRVPTASQTKSAARTLLHECFAIVERY
ncbi:hypothetical protein FA95DRAFT_1128838 [Auriscalpium vulgare]|uniref:Uncharacterized protein n=1 Tax=Auriscalpium vulgare TaxID=40419 RepID=A0ACB8R438_9AGAM|nr:hypothetical protein FA95DRAFT_1128838 [Auriscalpium vulgare]